MAGMCVYIYTYIHIYIHTHEPKQQTTQENGSSFGYRFQLCIPHQELKKNNCQLPTPIPPAGSREKHTSYLTSTSQLSDKFNPPAVLSGPTFHFKV